MAKESLIEQTGIITEMLPNAMSRVKLDIGNDNIILCTLSGKIRLSKIKLATGDKVKLEMSPYDLTRGRIIRRL